ncbi:DUF4349 domain-containing protein [Chungangia koreensis]|uniref:DUF4349 domain-containing protein n=1 Tax=Chungangia koreensis TaxID=752657 RepID=A0ABV8XAK5_9LACT
MRNQRIFFIWFISMFMLLAACSNNDSSGSMESADRAPADMAAEEAESSKVAMENTSEKKTTQSSNVEEAKSDSNITVNRMIIHKANLEVNVKNIEDAQASIEDKVNKYDGYIVESNVYREDETSSGKMTLRIPEQHFQAFLNDAEKEAAKILERQVTGQDVTEQYVDLESRLKSKRAVEERLLEFMKGAQKTEDLLKISTDLAKVQEEIEIIVGKMNYLKNQTSFSTIEIAMYENRVIIPDIEKEELNTWQKTKKQFVTSTNYLLSAGSALIVFFIGNLPILLLFLLTGAVVYFIVRKRVKKE